MFIDNPSKDYTEDPSARRDEWFRYYSEKRIGHQWFQVHLLQGLDVETVLEIGPGLGLVTAMLDNAGYRVTTLDFLPSQYDRPHIEHIQADLAEVEAERLAGFDAILCCETLEHFRWEAVDDLLRKFHAAAPRYLLFSVPFMGFQLDWRLYFNTSTWRSRFSFKKARALRAFKFDAEADPLGHKWEAGYRGRSLKALEQKIATCGWRVCRRDFTSPTRSVFYLLEPD
jgi:hypothetical protein